MPAGAHTVAAVAHLETETLPAKLGSAPAAPSRAIWFWPATVTLRPLPASEAPASM